MSGERYGGLKVWWTEGVVCGIVEWWEGVG